MPQTLCLLSIGSLSRDRRQLENLIGQAREAGFTGILCKSQETLVSGEPLVPASLIDACRAEGLQVIVQTNLRRVPVDHELVRNFPEHFRIQRSPDERGPVDPRVPIPLTGEALARLRDGANAELVETLASRLAELPREGLGGLRIENVERIAPQALEQLLLAVEPKEDFIILAGPFGEQREAARDVAEAGVDFLVSSLDWWDGRASWLVEELDELRSAAPVLCELGADKRQRGSANVRLPLAAALGSGFIAPIEWLEGTGADALRQAAQDVTRCATYSGELRRLSASSAPVSAFVRASGPDLRNSREVMVVLANCTEAAQPLPSNADWSGVAAQFGGFDGKAELAPNEVRLLAGKRTAPALGGFEAAPAAPSVEAARLVLEDVEPSIDGGAFAVKRVVGDVVQANASIFADGHEQLAAELRWRAVDEGEWQSMRMSQRPNDRWEGEFPLRRMGRHEFVVAAWLDRFGGFQRDFDKKVAAGVAQPVDRAEGRALVQKAAQRCKGTLGTALKKQLMAIDEAEEEVATQLLLSSDLRALMDEADDRPHRILSTPQPVDAERIEARFSSWYELFPRSMTSDPDRHGTLTDVIDHLPRIRAMGFDTLYFPPIHPIGKTNRKGPNNTLTPEEGDPGSPYAIGSLEGGHDAIHPELGTFEDFDRLVGAAAAHGLEIALDFAIQASPDHPWLKEHPGWFAWLPDGSMKYAENPPKKYQDIVNVDFYGPDAIPGLWEALRDVILVWVDHGVKTFRVDNPHTKPLPFWEWMIAEVRAKHPDVIFLSEAFTRPTMMYRLAKVGFSQSYTYFTWRDRKHELMEYITELTTEAPKDFYRPHFFVNTPDINPFFLQTGGRPAHLIRAVLAATLSGLWGVYSGFELCDATPLGAGKEEYLDSEKFEIRVRDWDAPGNIVDDVTRLNRLRRAHPALQTHLNTRFYAAHDDNVIWYGKPTLSADGALRELIMVMVNLDPHSAHECDFEIPLWEFGLSDQASVAVEDLVEGHRFDWHGKTQHIRLTPAEPYRIWRLFHHGEDA